jgi:alanine dehydrogenase
MDKSTYIIKRSEIENVLGMGEYINIVEEAFKLYGEGKVQMPPKVYLSFDKGDLRCMPAYLASMKAAGVKNVNVHPGNKTLPAVMATITLVDPETGFPLAIMDGTYITQMRTGAAGGIAAKYLSREDSKAAGFIGAGVQAESQLEALLITRPGISRIAAYDINETNVKRFADEARTKYGFKVEKTTSVKEAVEATDIVVTTTPVRTPIVKAEHIRKGTHINAIGADAPGKQELETKILETARIVIDNWEQASHGGEINVALSKGIISRGNIYADLGEIVTGKKPGRESSEQITVFDSTGLAIQDIAAASYIYRKLISDKNRIAKLEKVDLAG